MNKKQALLKTAEWVRNAPIEEKCMGSYAQNKDGRDVSFDSPDAATFCALGYYSREMGRWMDGNSSIWASFDIGVCYMRSAMSSIDEDMRKSYHAMACECLFRSAAALEREAEKL